MCHALIRLVGLLAVVVFAGAATGQSLPDWGTYREITIDNTGGSEALVDHQVRIALTAANFDFADAQAAGEDIRFTDIDQTTLLDHWIEIWDPVDEQAVLWVEVPDIAAGAAHTIYLYHDNPLASSTSDGFATFDFFDGFEDFGGGSDAMNAATYLTTPTYDGSGQVVHPDVVHVPGGWNGYEYWMAMTPYPNSVDDYENPSIIASHDGLTWEEPPGISNPLVAEPPDDGHNADPDLLLVDDTLVFYFYTSVDGANTMKRMTSTDGVNWTAPVVIDAHPHPERRVSPAVIYEDGTYHMWYVLSPTGCSDGSSEVYVRSSTDGLTWGTPELLDISLPGQVIWHINVQKVGTEYVMVFCAYPSGQSCASTSLYYASSSGRATGWEVVLEPLLAPSPSGWDSSRIYQSAFLDDGTTLRLWYSAYGGSGWRVGYTEGLLEDFFPADADTWDEILGDATASTEHPRTGNQGLRLVGASSPNRPGVFAYRSEPGFSFNAWLYDDLLAVNNFMAMLRVWDGVAPAIGTGLWMGESTSDYVFHGGGFQYATTGLAREAGWHRLTINVGPSASDILIDDQLVATRTDLDHNALERISLNGYEAGTGWFDDAYLRKLVLPEPIATVGPAVPNSADEVVLTPIPQASGPINCSTSRAVDFVLTPAPTSPPVRGYTVEVSATPELSFGTGDVTVHDLVPGEGQTAFVTEVTPGTVSVDVALNGDSSGLVGEVTAFTIVFHGAASGTGTVNMTDLVVRDLDNNDLPALADGTVEVLVDCELPGAVADLRGVSGHEQVSLSWQDPGDGDLVGLEVWRALWHDGSGASAYPEYDDLPGDVLPPRPADRAAAAVSADWTLIDTVAPGAESYEDAIAPRGIYRYEVFAVDLAANASPRAEAAPTRTNYRLGDFALPYDGEVDIDDIHVLGESFGVGEGDGSYNAECDIGPTDDSSARGLPTTDSEVQFEDLIIAAINFGTVAPAPAKGAPAPVSLAWREVEPGVWSLASVDVAPLQGLRLRLDLPAAALREVAAADGPWFLARGSQETIDLALVRLGRGAALAAGTELLRVHLTVGAEPVAVEITARDAANRDLTVQLSDQAPALPTAYAVHPASPNPFNPRTEIRYELPEAQTVRLGIYDLSGRLVRWLVREQVPAGRHAAVWDGTAEDGRAVPSGVYFWRVEAGPLRETGKMSLVK